MPKKTAAVTISGEVLVEAQRFRGRPRLEGASARRVRRLRIRDFRQMPDSGRVEMLEQWLEESRARLGLRRRGLASHPHPRLDECAHQPRPHGALMIRGVALMAIASVVRLIARLARRERAQADRRNQMFLDRIDDALRMRSFEERERQPTDRKNLVGSKRAVNFSYHMI